MRTLLIITILLSIISCSNTAKDNEPTMMQETKQIINDYPDTMIDSIHDAKKITEQYNQNWKDLQDSIQKSKVN